jgi:bifunctional ADP-heptose synthase (sugar kinase/adenylyltransferase)
MLFNEVLNTIPYYIQKNKRLVRFFAAVGATFVVVASVGISSFYVGRIVTYTQSQCPLVIDIPRSGAPMATDTSKSTSTLEKNIKPQKIETSIANRAGGVVVSKNGTKYHFPWCAGAGQIKEENKVWYTTEQDAISAGYTKAGNCQ